MGQENQTQKTLGFNTVGRKTRPKCHIWAKTIYGQRPYMGFNTVGQENQTQRPYMGKDHIWDSTQWDRETGPKDDRIQHSWDRETRPKDHIWAKTIYGIQNSWDRETRPKDHIWAKTIYGTQRPYGIQHSWDRETGPKDHRIQHSSDRENRTQRPYMGFNTVGQGNWTQRP